MISSPMEQILPIWILKLQVKSENIYSQSKKQNIIHSVRASCGSSISEASENSLFIKSINLFIIPNTPSSFAILYAY